MMAKILREAFTYESLPTQVSSNGLYQVLMPPHVEICWEMTLMGLILLSKGKYYSGQTNDASTKLPVHW
jgi:hypothetical protein